jgi:hypothetical protein
MCADMYVLTMLLPLLLLLLLLPYILDECIGYGHRP